MTRILVQRGSAGSSSSNSNRTSLPGSSTATPQPQIAPSPPFSVSKDEQSESEVQEQFTVDDRLDFCGGGDSRASENAELLLECSHADKSDSTSDEFVDSEKAVNDFFLSQEGLEGPMISDGSVAENEGSGCCPVPMIAGGSYPPPPPVPPPKPSLVNSNTRRSSPGSSNAIRNMPSRRPRAWPVVSTRSPPSGSRPSSPRSHGDVEGYNSADEQNPCFAFPYDDAEREHQFEIDIWRVKGLQVKRMLEDGNCLFRAIADQVYGDSEVFDLTRQLCIDYMEQERDHFSQFITEGFTSYCMRKRRDKVYGNNAEIQALSEIFNRPIHIYSYSTEPINIFHKGYNTDMPPIRLSYHHGNHYNSLVDPRRLTIGAGLGFSCLQGRDINKDEVKAAIKAQQDQQIDKALVAEGRFYSDLELTEKEIECMVMEASRAEYDKMQQTGSGGAEPSSSGGQGSVESSSSSMQTLLSMGFSYVQAREACGIFGEDVDSMVCYLLETESNSRRKGKAAE